MHVCVHACVIHVLTLLFYRLLYGLEKIKSKIFVCGIFHVHFTLGDLLRESLMFTLHPVIFDVMVVCMWPM